MNARLITIILSLGLLYSCDKEYVCSDMVADLGKIHLDTLSKSFIPYKGKEKIIFVNKDQAEVLFESKKPKAHGFVSLHTVLLP